MTSNLPLQSDYYRLFFEEAPIGLALCRMEDGSFVAVNRAFATILGRTVEATMGLQYLQVTPGKYKELEKEQLRLLKERGEYGPYEKEYLHRDGSLIPVRLRGRRIDIDGCEYIWSMVENLSGEKYRILFKRATVGLALCDMNGRLIDVNAQFASYVGFSEEELTEMTYWNVTPERYEPDEAKQLTKLIETGRYGPYTKHFIHKDGHEVEVVLTGMKIELDGSYYIWSIVEHGIYGGIVSVEPGPSPGGPSRPITPIEFSRARPLGYSQPIRPLEGGGP